MATEAATSAAVESSTPAAPISFQQAADAARAEHSTPEPAPAASTSTETAQEPTQATDPAAGASPDTAQPLISDADLASFAKLPEADRVKAINKRWTEKTQALSADRKAVEAERDKQTRLAKYADLIDALESDSEGTIAQLAQQNGMAVTKTTPAAAVKEHAQTTATSIADTAMSMVKEALGDEFGFLAPQLGKAIHGVAEAVAKAVAEQTVAPLKQAHEKVTTEAVAKGIEATTEAFFREFPDAKAHEGAMVALMSKVQPGEGMDDAAYLRMLYREVTHETREKSIEGRIADAVKAALKTASEGTATEERPAVTDAARVARTPGRKLSFAEAGQMALRGERIDREG